MGGRRSAFFGSRSAFFFSKVSKKKIFFSFQNRFKKVIIFPKGHADNFLEISSVVTPPMHFILDLSLVFFDKIRKFPVRKKNFGRRPKSLPKAEIPTEGRDPCSLP